MDANGSSTKLKRGWRICKAPECDELIHIAKKTCGVCGFVNIKKGYKKKAKVKSTYVPTGKPRGRPKGYKSAPKPKAPPVARGPAKGRGRPSKKMVAARAKKNSAPESADSGGSESKGSE